MNTRPLHFHTNPHSSLILQEQRLKALRDLPYPQFEALLRQMLLRCGFSTIRSLGGGHCRKAWGEGGLDLLALRSDRLGTQLVGIQIKQLHQNVGRRHIDELRGALLRWRIESGLLLTTSGFGSKSREAESLAILPTVRLFDGEALLALLEDTGLLGTNEVWPVGFAPQRDENNQNRKSDRSQGQSTQGPNDDEVAFGFREMARQTRALRREQRRARRWKRRDHLRNE